MTIETEPAPAPAPPRFAPGTAPETSNTRARFVGGPRNGETYTRGHRKPWPRYVDGDGKPMEGQRGDRWLRGTKDVEPCYLLHEGLESPAQYSERRMYVWSRDGQHAAMNLTWQMVATALAGTAVGRELAQGSDDPGDVLLALAGASDDLVRVRLKVDRGYRDRRSERRGVGQ